MENETFYLKNKNGELEFPLLAEGFRKLGLLYRLIQNETLTKGTILFWDEPEANLNPRLSRIVVQTLLALAQIGVQVFITTHDYILLKEFELASMQVNDVNILYHSLSYDCEGKVRHNAANDIDMINDNAINDTLSRILDDEITNGLADL